MTDPDGFLLAQVFEDASDVPPAQWPVVPLGVKLRPVDAGYVLRWREYPPDGEWYWRSGMVLALAPRACSVWVQPDERREGEGFAVVVDKVTAEGDAEARRRLGVSADYLSSARWQSPRSLPRAVLRADRLASGDAVTVQRYLHADPTCGYPPSFMADGVDRGEPVALDECYVFDRYLHPASVRPVDPGWSTIMGGHVRPCGKCLVEGRPT